MSLRIMVQTISINQCWKINSILKHHDFVEYFQIMVTSSNGNIFHVTGLCAGNSPVTGEFPSQRPMTRSFDVFFDLRLNKRLSKQSKSWWFETPRRSLLRHSFGLQVRPLCLKRRYLLCCGLSIDCKTGPFIVERSRVDFLHNGFVIRKRFRLMTSSYHN